jgi:imidazolonepropionase-like amidohydrolase
MIAIKAGRLIDGIADKPGIDMAILVEGKRIVDVLPAASLQPDPAMKIIDASNYSVLPGMVDCHIHVHSPGGSDRETSFGMLPLTELQGFLALRAFANSKKDLEMGFTTLRSLDSPGYVDVALRNAINQGLVKGPRLHVSGYGISVTGGHMDKAVWNPEVAVAGRTGVGDGPWGCRKAAREQLKRGVDVLKINACGGSLDLAEPWHQEMTLEEMAAVCDEAHRAKKRVAAHTSGGPAITDAILAGVNSIEHGPWLTNEQFDLMAERGVFYVPTLTTNGRGVQLGREEIGSGDDEWAWLLKVDEDKWDALARAKKAGVEIAVGTDAGFWIYHGENATEIEQLVRGGFSPIEAIKAATISGARCLGLEKEIGTIQKGKFADLVMVAGDPLADVRILQDRTKIRMVFKDGEIVS